MHIAAGISIHATPLKTIALALIIISLLIPTAQPAVNGSVHSALTNTTATITLTYQPTDFTFTTLNGYDVITTPTAGYTTTTGDPMLPAITLRVALPPHLQATTITITKQHTQTIPGTYTILPAQPPLTLDIEPPLHLATPNSTIYHSLIPYPHATAVLSGETDLAGQAIAIVTLYPLHYTGATKTLTLDTSITLTITGTPTHVYGDYLPTSLSASSQQQLASMVQSIVINPDAITLQTNPAPHRAGLPAGSYSYVIITKQAWVNAFQPLADWKTQKGVPATIVTTDWIYNQSGYSGTNVQKIRAFVQDAYNTWGTTFFLLGGDTNTIPCNYTLFSGVDSDPVPNDTYYADFDSDWTCEVNVGRASVTGTGTGNGQIGTFINKVLTYEKNPPLNYTMNASMFGFDLDSYTKGELCKKTIDTNDIPNNWTMTNVYDSDSGNHKTNAIAAMNAGQNLINHADHSNTDVMGIGYINHNYLLSTSDMDSLTNGNKQGILYSMGCDPASYDVGACIAEHYVRNTHGGGLAFIGNSRYGWFNPGYYNTLSMGYDQAFFHSLFIEHYYILGQAFTDHKNDAVHNDNYYHYIFTELTLLGDPQLPIWTATPRALTVTHPATVPAGISSYTVHVTNNTTPLSNATVCLWKPNNIYQTSTTNQNGNATFTINATIGILNVTVTKHNYLPNITTTTITTLGDTPPVATNDTYNITTNAVNVTLNVLANDYDANNNTLTIINTTTPLHGTTSTNGTYAFYTPTTNYSGPDAFQYTISDNNGSNATATVTLTVHPTNHPPIAHNDTLTMNQYGPTTAIHVLANDTDQDADTLTITTITQPSHGNATHNTTTVFYTPTPTYYGADTMTYTISDGFGGTATATINITILHVNLPPIAQNDTLTVMENATTTPVNVLANDTDPDNDTLTIQNVTQPNHGNTSTNGTYAFYTPTPSYYGTDAFTYTIIDPHHDTATATVHVTITRFNHQPVAHNDSITISQRNPQTAINVLSNDTDPDSDTLTISTITQPSHGIASHNPTIVFYTPTPTYNGTDTMTYTISDGYNGTATATIHITITPLSPPVAHNDTYTINQDTVNNTFNVLSNDYDPDNDTLTITNTTTPLHGTITHTTTIIHYTPTHSYTGTDTFNYNITDSHNSYATAKVTVHITSTNDNPPGGPSEPSGPANHPPHANLTTSTYHSFVNETLNFDASHSTDVDGTITRYAWDFDDNTTTTGMTATHRYTQAGVYHVTLTVTDNGNLTNTTHALCTIRPPNHAPTTPTMNGSYDGTRNTQYSFTITSTDPDNDTLRYHITWGDGTPDTITEYVTNHTSQTMNHTWTTSNAYPLTAWAEDAYGATSPAIHILVLIDTTILYLNGTLPGYLLDVNKTGVYTLFHDNATGITVKVTRQASGYLIDTNNDGTPEYLYTSLHGLVPYETTKPATPGFETATFLIACLAFTLLTRTRYKRRR